MRKRIKFLLIILGFLILFGANNGLAQVNPDLIKDLNDLFVFDIKLMQQCESNSEEFSIFIPYNQIISEKQQTIKALAELIDSFGVDISDKRFKLEKPLHNYQALNQDANSQIKLISMYNNILSKFGHPKVQAYAIKAKNQAIIHYMLLSTAAQRIIADNQVKEIIQNKYP